MANLTDFMPSQEYENELNFLNRTPSPNIEILPLFFKKLRVLGSLGSRRWGGNAVSYLGVTVGVI